MDSRKATRFFGKEFEAREWFREYKENSEEIPLYPDGDSNYSNREMGEWVLFRHEKSINGKSHLSRPILGLFIEYDVWDMALVLTIIEPVRAWEYKNRRPL